LAAGVPSFQVVSAAFRHFNYLEVARASFDAGVPARTVVERGRPPFYGPRAARMADTIARWPLPRIRKALAIFDDALFDSRLRGFFFFGGCRLAGSWLASDSVARRLMPSSAVRSAAASGSGSDRSARACPADRRPSRM